MKEINIIVPDWVNVEDLVEHIQDNQCSCVFKECKTFSGDISEFVKALKESD